MSKIVLETEKAKCPKMTSIAYGRRYFCLLACCCQTGANIDIRRCRTRSAGNGAHITSYRKFDMIIAFVIKNALHESLLCRMGVFVIRRTSKGKKAFLPSSNLSKRNIIQEDDILLLNGPRAVSLNDILRNNTAKTLLSRNR